MSDCLLCTAPDGSPMSLDGAAVIATTSRHGHPSRRVSCAQCGLVQVAPQPTEAELASYYRSHAYRAEHGPVEISLTTPHGISRVVQPQDSDYEEALDAMGEYRYGWAAEHAGLVRGMRVLELGSGDGRTLAMFAKNGLECTGVEPDEAEAKSSAARIPGAGIIIGTIDSYLDDSEETYDTITMFHVLEHLHRPLETLRRLREELTPRGALVIEVPNILEPNPDVDGYHLQHVHLTDWSEHTLLAALVTAQYEPTWIQASGNLRCVARPAIKAVEYDCPGRSGEYIEGYLDGIRRMHRGGV